MKILILNAPSDDITLNRDMAGGLGFSGGEGVVLPPIDLLNMVTSLKKTGNKVFFVDLVADRENGKEKMDIFLKNGVDYVIGNFSLPTLEVDAKFYKNLRKKYPKVKIWVKTGISYLFLLKKFLKLSLVEAIVLSEADNDIEKYLKGNKKNGLVKKEKGKYIFNLKIERVNDIDTLPLPDFTVIDKSRYKYSLLEGECLTIQTSRGCPYPCRYYCPYPLVQGRIWRYMTPERVIKEIENVLDVGVKSVLFRDATFTLDMDRVKKICHLIISKKIKFKWWCETRINVLDEDLLILMKKAGCQGINVGVETMSQQLIKIEGKPGVTVNDVIKIREIAKRLGIKLHFLLIVGLLSETVTSLSETYELLKILKPESVGITVITPYPGTDLFEDAKKEKLIDDFDWSKFDGTKTNMRSRYLSKVEIKFGRNLLLASQKFGKFCWPLIDLVFILWKTKVKLF